MPDVRVMPAGSMPPEDPQVMAVDPGTDAAAMAAEAAAAAEAAKPKEPEPILGKFKTQDDLVKSYQSLEQQLGKQGEELGSLKKTNETLLKAFEKAGGKDTGKEQQAQEVPYEQQIAALSQQVEEGNLSIGEALVKSTQMAVEMATRNTLQKVDEVQQKRGLEATQQQFLKDNPDFTQLRESGTLDQVKQTLPGLHDDFSAYYALKAQQAAAAVEQARAEGIAAGKVEAARIADGDKRTEKVIAQPGGPQVQNLGRAPKPMSDYEMKQSMLAKLG